MSDCSGISDIIQKVVIDYRKALHAYVDNRVDKLIGIAQDVVRIPSENKAPQGFEQACQEYIEGRLREHGWSPSLYTPDQAPGIADHPLFWKGRDYASRPNLAAVRKGRGRGKSLILSGHIDTVPAGSQQWQHEPFSGVVEGNRLYGRGSNDMKSGIAANLFVAEALTELGVELQGDLTFESVVDEEFGGVNGTLAGRLMGYRADAAIISEPTALRVCPAQRGGRTVDITFRAPNTGILGGPAGAGVVDQLRVFLDELRSFSEMRLQTAPIHRLYEHLHNPVPVTVTRVFTAPWGTTEPTNTPSECRVQLFWQCMPGERVADVDGQFFGWFEQMISSHPTTFAERPTTEFPIRWLPASALTPDHELVQELSFTASRLLNDQPLVQGIEGPCDLYVFHEFGIPAVLWGVSGGNTHNPDEYVNIDSLVSATKVLLAFVCQWCGVVGPGEISS